MLQTDRNWLFNAAYRLDNLTRLWIPKSDRAKILAVSPEDVERMRIQERTLNLHVLFSEQELADLADQLRNLAANDEARILR